MREFVTSLIPMKLNVDKEADALYLRLDDSPIVESEEVSPGVVLDYNEANEVVGVEMLYLSKALVQPESVGVAVRDGLSNAAFTKPRARGHAPGRRLRRPRGRRV